MIDCEMTIRWQNRSVPAGLEDYKIQFLPRVLGSDFFGATGSIFVIGKDSLRGYLLNRIDRDAQRERSEDQVNEWLNELHDKGSLSLPHVQLTEQQFEDYRKASRS
jgi:hypothetical protein